MMCHVLYWARLFVNSSPIHWIGFTPEPQYFFFRQLSNYYILPSNLEYKWHQIPEVKYFSSCLAVVNPLKPGVKPRMKMEDVVGAAPMEAMLQLHLSEQQFYCPLRCIYIRDLMLGV